MKRTPHRGYLMLLAIAFGAVFLTVFGGMTFFVLSENKLQSQNTLSTEAFALAEAGLEYYRWHLAHFPDDLQNGTGVPGPYVMDYDDPEGGLAGTITLDILNNTSCNQSNSIDIESTGASASAPGVTRTVSARYARPSVGLYSYIVNDSLWAGADRVISGPFHTNGGIRMDGTSNSTVSSSLSTWNCTSTYGCIPDNPTAPGVTGTGVDQALWEYPVPQVDFAAIAADFGSLKTIAEASGTYLERYSTTNGQGDPAYWRGYHLTFNADGTVTVKQVSSTRQNSVTPVNSADGNTDRIEIQNESQTEITLIPPDCGLIFVEDNVWIDGIVDGKITLVAANVENANITPNVYVQSDVVYENTDGSDGLTVIAARNVLISPQAPESMTLNGIFIAQGGAFGMNAYSCNSGFATKSGTLTILGTTVSNKRTGTKWTSTCSNGLYKGYQTRIDSFDRRNATDPPAFTPVVSQDYEFIDWKEE
ncbi:MAG: hypothetical protein WBK28_02685 [Minisyncoccia bacterium]